MKVLLTEKQIQKRVRELGKEISADYEGKDLFIVSVLKGSALFLADLVRCITVPVKYDFMAVSSYGPSTKSSGVVKITKDLDEPIESEHVLIVEDVMDSGLTLHYIEANLRARNVASLNVCTLLDRPAHRKAIVNVKYNGFTIPDSYVVGYGLDLNQKHRNERNIYLLNE